MLKYVTFATCEKLFYRYVASCRMLTHTQNTNTSANDKFTDYVCDTIYVNNQSILTGTPEGSLLPDGKCRWQPEYHMKDHTRQQSRRGTLLPGYADVQQATSYYLFG